MFKTTQASPRVPSSQEVQRRSVTEHRAPPSANRTQHAYTNGAFVSYYIRVYKGKIQELEYSHICL